MDYLHTYNQYISSTELLQQQPSRGYLFTREEDRLTAADEIDLSTDISGVVIVAFILVGIGIIILVKALFFREG